MTTTADLKDFLQMHGPLEYLAGMEKYGAAPRLDRLHGMNEPSPLGAIRANPSLSLNGGGCRFEFILQKENKKRGGCRCFFCAFYPTIWDSSPLNQT